jgi:hypothetical protein
MGRVEAMLNVEPIIREATVTPHFRANRDLDEAVPQAFQLLPVHRQA